MRVNKLPLFVNTLSLIGLLLLSASLISCERQEKTHKDGLTDKNNYGIAPDTVPLEDDSKLDTEMASGNISAYTKAAAHSFVHDHEREFFYYSFVFANKFHYPHAYYNMYYELTANSVHGGDSATRYFALYCLARAAEMNDTNASNEIIELEKECNCNLQESSAFLRLFDRATRSLR